MDSWLVENPPMPISPHKNDLELDSCTDSQATNNTCKECSQMECQVPPDRRIVNIVYSDTDSDGVEAEINSSEITTIPVNQPYNSSDTSITESDYPNHLPSPLLLLSSSSSATHSDYCYHQDEPSVPPLYKLRVCREGNDSTSLLGRPRCEICQLNPCNTCLMHHLSRHTDLCYSCAAIHFAEGHVCPLCPNRIVYIYKYDDL